MELRTVNKRTVRNVVKSAIVPGDKITAMILSRKILEDYGLYINWHEVSSILDELHTSLLLGVSGHNGDGMTEYYVK